VGRVTSSLGGVVSSAKGAGSSLLGLVGAGGALSLTAVGLGAVAVGAVALAAAGIGAIAFLSHLASHGAKSALEMRKLALQIGVTTEFAAAMSTQGDHLAHAMFHMSHSVAALSGQGHGLAPILAKLGLDLQTFASADTEDQLNMLAASWGNLTSHVERAQAARALWGRGGVEMLDIMSRGSAGLEEMRRRAERFGLAMTQAETDLVRQGTRAWSQIGQAWDGFQRQLAVGFAPLWEKLGNIGAWLGERLVTAVKEWIPVMHEAWHILQAMWDVSQNIIQAIGSGMAAALGLSRSSLHDFRDAFLRAGVGIEYGIKNWQLIMDVVVNAMKTKWEEFEGSIMRMIRRIAQAINQYLPSQFALNLEGLNNLITESDERAATARQAWQNAAGAVGAGFNALLEQRLREWRDLLAPSARPGGGPAAGAQYKTVQGNELALAGSERAYEILFSNQATQEQLMQAQLTAQNGALGQLQQILQQLMNHPIVIGPI
jgi:hypothetical protein